MGKDILEGLAEFVGNIIAWVIALALLAGVFWFVGIWFGTALSAGIGGKALVFADKPWVTQVILWSPLGLAVLAFLGVFWQMVLVYILGALYLVALALNALFWVATSVIWLPVYLVSKLIKVDIFKKLGLSLFSVQFLDLYIRGEKFCHRGADDLETVELYRRWAWSTTDEEDRQYKKLYNETHGIHEETLDEIGNSIDILTWASRGPSGPLL